MHSNKTEYNNNIGSLFNTYIRYVLKVLVDFLSYFSIYHQTHSYWPEKQLNQKYLDSFGYCITGNSLQNRIKKDNFLKDDILIFTSRIEQNVSFSSVYVLNAPYLMLPSRVYLSLEEYS